MANINLAERRNQIISMAKSSQSSTKKKKKKSETEKLIETRRKAVQKQVNKRRDSVPAVQPTYKQQEYQTPSQQAANDQKQKQPSLMEKIKGGFTKAKEAVVSTVKTGINKAKEAFIDQEEKFKQQGLSVQGIKQQAQAGQLDYGQMFEFSTVPFLQKSKIDTLNKIRELESKEKKSKIDSYRIKNLTEKYNKTDSLLQATPEERKKNQKFITQLALERTAASITTGLLSTLETLPKAVTWVAESKGKEGVAQASKGISNKLKQWSDAVRPEDEDLADQLLQGVGSSLAFYIPGLGVSKGTSMLAKVSPKLAMFFGQSTMAALESASEAGSVYEEVKNQGKTVEEANMAANNTFWANVAFNIVSEKFGILSEGQKLRVLKTATSEGIEEMAQQVISNVNTGRPYDEGLIESGLIGAVVGGTMGAAIPGQETDVEEAGVAEKKITGEQVKTEMPANVEGVVGPNLLQKIQESRQVEVTQKQETAPKTEVAAADLTKKPTKEAKKYKTAKEYVESMINAEHGTKADFTEFKSVNPEKGEAIYLSDVGDQKAKSLSGNGGKLMKVAVDEKKVKTFDPRDTANKEVQEIIKRVVSQDERASRGYYYDAENFKDSKALNHRDIDDTWQAQIIKEGSKFGYNDFRTYEQSTREWSRAITDNSLLKTETQLVEQWNQSQPYPPQSTLSDINPLIQEAKKYKSAEEFVKAQGTSVYRGGASLSKEKITKAGISVSKSKNVADDFAKQRGGRVEKILISKNAKIIDYSDVPNVKFKKLNDYSPELDTDNKQIWEDLEVEYEKAINWAKENGYDGVKLPLEGEIRIINKNILKTESQLTDIYNQANTPTKTKIKPKEVSVSRAQLPVKTEGKQRVSKLEARIKQTLGNVSQDVIDRMGLSTYEQVNKKENIKAAAEYAINNPNEAMAVLRGEKEAPNGILTNSLFVAMQNNSIGDVDLARKLASLQSTRYGQELSVLTEIDPDSPVKLMGDIIKIKEETFKKRHKNKSPTKEIKKVAKEIKAKIEAPTKSDWQSFIDSIQC